MSSPHHQSIANLVAEGLARLDKMIPGLSEVDTRYGFSAHCATSLFEEVKRNSGGQNDLLESVIAHASEPLSYLALYDQLASENVLRRENTRHILDLGCGYRLSSIVYQLLFPDLFRCISIDRNAEKAENGTALRAYRFNPDKFDLRIGSFYAPSDAEIWKGASGTRYAFLQSFHDGHEDRSKELLPFLRQVGSLLTPDGALIVTIDKRDLETYQYRASIQLVTALQRINGIKQIQMQRMVPCGHFGMNHSIDTEVFVAPRVGLVSLRG